VKLIDPQLHHIRAGLRRADRVTLRLLEISDEDGRAEKSHV